MTRTRSCLAALVGVAALATPALPVTVANTAWNTTGKAIAKVKGLGRSKTDAELLLQFYAGGDARAEDAFERVFTGTYGVTGRKLDKVEMTLDTGSTTRLESLIESEIEAAVLRKAGESVDVTVDVTSIKARADVNGKGTKIRFKLKAKAIGYADVDLKRRRTSYTVSTKGAPAF